MYNKGTLKNGHLKKIQMAHHRLSPVTRNMYEVISEIYRIVKKTLHMVRRKQRSVVQVHERRRFRWRQLKNIFIMMVTQNWEVVSTRDAFKIKAWISPYVDAEYSMVEVPGRRYLIPDLIHRDCSQHKIWVVFQGHQVISHTARPVLIRGWYIYKFMQCMLWVDAIRTLIVYIPVSLISRHNEFFHRYL